MVTKIIFILEYPFSLRDYQRFGIGLLRKNGFEVDIWDFSPVLYPEVYQRIQLLDPQHDAGLRQFVTQAEALQAIAHLPSTCFVMCLASYQFISFPVYRALSQNKVRYGVAQVNALPPASAGTDRPDVFRKLTQLTPAKLENYIFQRVPFPWLGVRSATAALAGGARSIQDPYPMDAGTKIVWAHTLDYDLYLQAAAQAAQVDAQQGVFLDNYLPFHPEYLLYGTPPIRAETYFPLLCRFFAHLEQIYGVHIVVAAHPRSRYEDHPDYFEGRPVCRDQTLQLVRQSGFVLAHHSTALNFAVLFKKPTLFLTTSVIERDPSVGAMIRVMAGWLNKTPIDLDQQPFNLDWGRELTVDQPAYAAYREAYIKRSISPDKPCWQILADFVKTLE